MNKILIICGPTATGKTDLAVALAKKFGGEIISADSRQVYKGMDVITGKDLPADSELKIKNSELKITDDKLEVGYRLKDDIPVWLVDIVEPDYPFNAGEYGVCAQKVISDIWARNKLPIVTGGTGFYIRTIINPYDTYMIPPNKVLRKELEKLDVLALQKKLQEKDKGKWDSMNDSDRSNPRRLVRAIEVADWKKDFSQKLSDSAALQKDILLIGLKMDFKKLRGKIDKRVVDRLEKGAQEEVKKLIEKKYSWFLPSLTATGALEIKKYITGEQTFTEAVEGWQYREMDYVKKQMTYFKKFLKENGGVWFGVSDKNSFPKIEEIVGKWYTAS